MTIIVSPWLILTIIESPWLWLLLTLRLSSTFLNSPRFSLTPWFIDSLIHRLLESTRPSPWISLTVLDCPWLLDSLTITDSPWLSWDPIDYNWFYLNHLNFPWPSLTLRLSLILCDSPWFVLTLLDSTWLSSIILELPWLSDSPWLSLTLLGSFWPFLTLLDSPCFYLTLLEFPWLSTFCDSLILLDPQTLLDSPWLSSLKHCPQDEQSIAGIRIKPTLRVRNLGVMVDGELTMANHISHLTRTCFYHLRQLHVVMRSLTMDTAHSLIRALVHSRLDYCNGTLAGLPQYQLNKLQSILRASARLVLLLPGRASVSSLMRVRLHWLPFPQRIKFKLCSTVYKCLHDAAPAYLSEFCVPLFSQAGHSRLHSAAAGDLLIPLTRTVTIGGRGFSVAGPVAWNSLPMDLKDGTLTFPAFKKLLKTHLFVTIWTAALRFRGDCMKGALQVPVSIQFNSKSFTLLDSPWLSLTLLDSPCWLFDYHWLLDYPWLSNSPWLSLTHSLSSTLLDYHWLY